jgi:putative flippase GtrA
MFLRFLLVGGTGFIIDASLTYGLIRLGMGEEWARIPALAIAITFTWLANRRFTYAVRVARSRREAARYFVTASTMALANYAAYALFLRFSVHPLIAVTFATALQVVVSFYAYRIFAFRD